MSAIEFLKDRNFAGLPERDVTNVQPDPNVSHLQEPDEEVRPCLLVVLPAGRRKQRPRSDLSRLGLVAVRKHHESQEYLPFFSVVINEV